MQFVQKQERSPEPQNRVVVVVVVVVVVGSTCVCRRAGCVDFFAGMC